MQRAEVQALVSSPGRPQLGHEPNYLLLQRRRDVEHLQEPDALHLQWHPPSKVIQGQQPH